MPNADPALLQDPERLRKVRELMLLDSAPSRIFERLARLASQIVKTPIAAVSLLDGERQYFLGQIGLPEPAASQSEVPLSHSFCQHLVATQSPLIIEDARQHPLVHDNPSIESMGVVAYAGLPLCAEDGAVLGSFCVVDQQPRRWTQEELAVLSELAISAIEEIRLRSELSERERIEKTLFENVNFIQRVHDMVPSVIYIYDLVERRNLYANREIANVLGYSSEDVFDLGGDILRGLMHPEDLPRVLDIHRQIMTDTDNKDTVYEVEYRMRDASGQWRWLLSRDVVFKRAEDGTPQQLLGVAHDITQRREAEEALRMSVERLEALRRIDDELSHSLDLESVLMLGMDAVLRATGARDGFIGLLEDDAVRIVHAVGSYRTGEVIGGDNEVIGAVLQSQRPLLIDHLDASRSVPTIAPDTCAIMCVPLIYRDRFNGIILLETPHQGRFTKDALDFLSLMVGRLTVAIDNAQLYALSQKQLYELQDLYMRVSELEQMKTDMIRIAAHDLRNPLGVVLGFSELLLEEQDGLSENQRTFIGSIAQAGRKMQRIISDILSLQRIEAMSSQHKQVDLAGIVRACYSEALPAAETKRLALTLDMVCSAILVQGDEAQLREAIDNLIHNAIKYTPEGGRVVVSLGVENGRARFTVTDTGYGIPEPLQARLFQPFFRARTAETAQIEGSGLGLHLVKNIVRRHHGEMIFRSTYGEGSTFGFKLPTV